MSKAKALAVNHYLVARTFEKRQNPALNNVLLITHYDFDSGGPQAISLTIDELRSLADWAEEVYNNV